MILVIGTLPFCFQSNPPGFVWKRGGLDNTWQEHEIGAWLQVYNEETPEDRKGDRWKKFSAKLWREHHVRKDNQQCCNHVCNMTYRILCWCLRVFVQYVIIHVTPVLSVCRRCELFLHQYLVPFQKTQMKICFNRLTNQMGRSGDMTETDKMIMRIMRKDKDIVGDTVGSSSRGIEVRGTNAAIQFSVEIL